MCGNSSGFFVLKTMAETGRSPPEVKCRLTSCQLDSFIGSLLTPVEEKVT